jgi:hypothetical protein
MMELGPGEEFRESRRRDLRKIAERFAGGKLCCLDI